MLPTSMARLAPVIHKPSRTPPARTISITSNHIAYLRREVEEPSSPPIAYGNATPLSHNTSATGNGEREARAQGVKPKYRDPKTNETWSGRGRMASWLKSKQDAGENIEKYLI